MKRQEREARKYLYIFIFSFGREEETNKMRMFQDCMELWNKNIRSLGSVLFVVRRQKIGSKFDVGFTGQKF